MQKNKYIEIPIDDECVIFHIGPPLDRQELPAVFYFALSAKESLFVSPFNQPIQFLSAYPIRIFSINLPYHNAPYCPKNSLHTWSEEIGQNNDIISSFVEKIKKAVNYLISNKLVIPEKIATIGLSRGGFIALQTAAKIDEIKFILGFAPLIDLASIIEFKNLSQNKILLSLQSDHLIPSLLDKHIRLYVGNKDTRVGTQNCCSFIQKIVQTAFRKKIKKTDAEVIISPSIGIEGHGTSKETFEEGCKWLIKGLLSGENKL